MTVCRNSYSARAGTALRPYSLRWRPTTVRTGSRESDWSSASRPKRLLCADTVLRANSHGNGDISRRLMAWCAWAVAGTRYSRRYKLTRTCCIAVPAIRQKILPLSAHGYTFCHDDCNVPAGLVWLLRAGFSLDPRLALFRNSPSMQTSERTSKSNYDDGTCHVLLYVATAR